VNLADGTPLYFRIEVPHSQVAALQGLTQQIAYRNGRTEERAVSQIEVNDAQITEASWEGAIRLEHGGEYEFRGEDGLQVFLDDQPIEVKRYLGRGLYRLRLLWERGSSRDPQLLWQVNNGPEPVPQKHFSITQPPQGLLGTYWLGMNWEGEPVFDK
jgi:hypothetical protein